AHGDLSRAVDHAPAQQHQRRPPDLVALLDAQREARRRLEPMLEQVRAQEGGAVAGCRVFACAVRLEEETGAEVAVRLAGFATEEVDELRQAERREPAEAGAVDRAAP